MRFAHRSAWALAAATLAAIAPSPAGAQERPPAPRNFWAVVIGVEKYDSREIQPAPRSRADSYAVYEWLRASLGEGWAARGLFHADADGEESLADPRRGGVRVKPTHANLTKGLREWLRHKVRPQDGAARPEESRDVVLIYFAGHAIGLPPTANEDLERDYLLPSDAKPNNWALNGLALEEFLEPANDDPLRDCTVICWLDTGLRGRGVTPACWPADARPDSKLFLARLAAWPGRSVWLAADGRPSGLTADGKGGLLTRALLDAMGPPGPGPDEGGGLMGTLARLRANRNLGEQGFLSMGAIPRGLALREADLKPLPPRPDQLVLQRGHSRKVGHFALTADDQALITGSDDSSIRLWKLNSREVYRTFADQFDGVQALALDPGGRLIIVGDGVGNVRGYDVGRLEPVRVSPRVPNHTERIAEIALLPGKATRFVTRDEATDRNGRARGGRLLLWEWKEGNAIEGNAFPGDAGADNPPRWLRIAATANPEAPACLIALDERGNLHAFDREMRPLGPARPQGKAIDIAAIALDPGGSRALVATDGGELRVIDLATGMTSSDNLGIRVENKGVLLGTSGVALAIGRQGRAVLVPIDKLAGKLAFPEKVARAAWSEDGRYLATAEASGPPRLWRIVPGAKPSQVEIELANGAARDQASSVWIGRGRLIAGDGQGGVRIWALPGIEPGGRAAFQQVFKPSRGRVQRVRIDGEGNRLVVLMAADNLCWTWDLRADQAPRSLLGRVKAVEILPDGSGLAVCREGGNGVGGRIELVDWQGQALEPRLEPPAGRAVIGFDDVSVSPDGRWLAGRCDGNLNRAAQVVLWDRTGQEPGRPVATIDDHPNVVKAAVFSADSKRLLTIDKGGDARVLDLANPAAPPPLGDRFELGKAAGLKQPVQLTAAAFDPEDPTQFVVGTARGEVVHCRTARAIQDRPPPGGSARPASPARRPAWPSRKAPPAPAGSAPRSRTPPCDSGRLPTIVSMPKISRSGSGSTRSRSIASSPGRSPTCRCWSAAATTGRSASGACNPTARCPSR
ncbi:MAG: WD40 repeat domain-containing protein [Isosphaeraceae bacterium]